MELKPLENKSLVNYIVDNILVQVKNGKLKPGEKIESQRDLAKKLNVSMGCIREALLALELANIVQIIPGKGTFIGELTFNEIFNPTDTAFSVTKENLLDLLELRIILESQAVKLVCQKASDSEIKRIGKILEREHPLVEDWKMDFYIKNNLDFHLEIINCTHNKILKKIYESTVHKLMKYIDKAIKKESDLNFAHKGHEEIYKYISLRDTENAEKAMESHLVKAAEITSKI
jgi:GntR family transcriptional regulator, transcriptional repressor for pyruvate dehydrogenase complex